MSCEFRIFRHFVNIFRNLVIFRMSYLLNQMRFSKTFFTFKFFSEYSFKIANLLWHKLKLIFCCQSYDVIFAPKTVEIKNPKTYDCWENKVLLSCKVSAQRLKIEKLVWKRSVFDDSWPGVNNSRQLVPCSKQLFKRPCHIISIEIPHKNCRFFAL